MIIARPKQRRQKAPSFHRKGPQVGKIADLPWCPRGTTFHEIKHDGFRIMARRDAAGGGSSLEMATISPVAIKLASQYLAISFARDSWGTKPTGDRRC